MHRHRHRQEEEEAAVEDSALPQRPSLSVVVPMGLVGALPRAHGAVISRGLRLSVMLGMRQLLQDAEQVLRMR